MLFKFSRCCTVIILPDSSTRLKIVLCFIIATEKKFTRVSQAARISPTHHLLSDTQSPIKVFHLFWGTRFQWELLFLQKVIWNEQYKVPFHDFWQHFSGEYIFNRILAGFQTLSYNEMNFHVSICLLGDSFRPSLTMVIDTRERFVTRMTVSARAEWALKKAVTDQALPRCGDGSLFNALCTIVIRSGHSRSWIWNSDLVANSALRHFSHEQFTFLLLFKSYRNMKWGGTLRPSKFTHRVSFLNYVVPSETNRSSTLESALQSFMLLLKNLQ